MKTLQFIFLLITSVLLTTNLHAKTNTDDTTQSVIVIKDERLYALDRRPEVMRLLAENLAKKEEVADKEETPTYNPIQAGRKKVTGSITQQQGFRVQIYNGADRAVAMKIKSAFNKAYPSMRSYLNYSIPNFKIKVGDFETKKEATNFLNRIKTLVPNAFIVPDVVTIKNIIVQ